MNALQSIAVSLALAILIVVGAGVALRYECREESNGNSRKLKALCGHKARARAARPRTD